MANNIDDFADKPEKPSYKAYFLTHLDSLSFRLQLSTISVSSYRLFVCLMRA